jgi:hypothetical protein
MVTRILDLFGDATGLKTNVHKSSVAPIRCSQLVVQEVMDVFPCKIDEFPIKYLGLPLSLKKLSKAQLQPLTDRLADLLPGWKADLMTRAGRATIVQFVLTATVIYHAMAVDLPKWALKAIDKVRQGFLWRGRKKANGGHCLVAWRKVTRPKELGGLGISDIHCLNWALRVRWLWLAKTDPSKPWADLPLKTNGMVQSLFIHGMDSVLGDGRNILFWKDRWLLGQRIPDLVPHVFTAVPAILVNKRTVAEAMDKMCWVSDLRGLVTPELIVEVLQLCDATSSVLLWPGFSDKHFWRFSSPKEYSAKSAYEVTFFGSTMFRPFERVCKSWPPAKCKFFIWLVLQDSCWTADRLERRGLPHLAACPLCHQEAKNINHLLTKCLLEAVLVPSLAPVWLGCPFSRPFR